MPGQGSSPTEGVVSTPVEVVLRGLQSRLGRVRPTLGGAVTGRVLIKSFLWKPNKNVSELFITTVKRVSTQWRILYFML